MTIYFYLQYIRIECDDNPLTTFSPVFYSIFYVYDKKVPFPYFADVKMGKNLIKKDLFLKKSTVRLCLCKNDMSY